ncbi:hypothetical protein NOR_07922 [Metarhizium rileyi]|uniref:Uncharacterized protein n=1 Tax=Metarhizium rileyi (strain RCEF 4871) TaxID=1649241 RepID=A0A166X8I5_METRR|nr:hypothetical protein NOR_07922 [Metarhizium rileyi RCEF 4871]
MRFESFAPEILCIILSQLDSCRELFTVTSTSSYCFRIFKIAQLGIITAVLGNSMLPETLHHAIAAVDAPVSPADELELRNYLQSYFSSWDDPSKYNVTRGNMMKLARYTARVEWLTDYFVQTAMLRIGMAARSPSTGDENDSEPLAGVLKKYEKGIGWQCGQHAWEKYNAVLSTDHRGGFLSKGERDRLYKAFFRLGMCIQCISPLSQDRIDVMISVRQQYVTFLSNLHPWEVEELLCLHEFFSSQLMEVVDDMESEFVVRARCAALLANKPNEGSNSLIKGRMMLEDALHGERSPLCFFSDRARPWTGQEIENMLSLGFGFLVKVFRSDKQTRIDTFTMKTTSLPRDLFKAAIRQYPTLQVDTTSEHMEDSDASSRDEDKCYGNSLGERSDYWEVYMRIWQGTGNRRDVSTRQLGYIFWDAPRGLQRDIVMQLPISHSIFYTFRSAILKQANDESAQTQLRHVPIPFDIAQRLVGECKGHRNRIF